MKRLNFIADNDLLKIIEDNLYENRLKNVAESIRDLILCGQKYKKPQPE